MALNYDKIKAKHNEETVWVSYSDLATVMSVLFLLLYVTSMVRSSSVSISEQMSAKQAEVQVQDLKQQIHAFDVLKEEYLNKGASQMEKEMYGELLGHMKLLETETKTEKLELRRKARENEVKERGLNKYQAIIKNIINANMIAQSQMKKRDVIIQKKSKNIAEMNKTIKEREVQLTRNNNEIENIQKKLEKSITEVEYAYRSKANSKKKMQDEIARMRQDSASRVAVLENKNNQVANQLASAREQITEKTRELQVKEGEVAKLEGEKQKILGDLQQRQKTYQASIGDLKQQYENTLDKNRQAFENSLNQEKLGGEARVAREKAYREQAEREKAEYDAKMRGLASQLDGTKKSIADKEAQYQSSLRQLAGAKKGLETELEGTRRAMGEKESQYKGSLDQMAKSKQGLERQLASVREREAEKKSIIDAIRKGFTQAGIDADINPRTGEVTINFGSEYFDYGRSEMKDGMAQILKKAIPTYAESLFHDSKLAQRVASVEIIGFASPTFRGKYVNPKDLSSEARTAVNYNMDLSYQRAKAMFEFVFDPKRMDYKFQRDLLSLAKVSGQSYLKAAGTGSDKKLTDDEYCQKFDCTKSQKVVIKFNFAEK